MRLQIFCCHGGIPPPWHFSDLKAINHIPVPLPLPDQQSDLAWNLMWNDPFRVYACTFETIVEIAH